MPLDTSITPDRIAETERLIRPHIRWYLIKGCSVGLRCT